MKVLSYIGLFVVGLVKFVRNMLYIGVSFLICFFVLSVIMPENVKIVLDTFLGFFG